MTDDAVAVLDALGWKQAHIFGASLGGVIAQRLALRHPDRVLSVVSAGSLPSDVSGIGGGRYVRFGLLARLARAKFPEGREGDIALGLMLARAVAGPAYPFDEDAAREWIEREVDQGPRDQKAQSRQAGAPWHGGKLRDLHKPVLVLHGDQDPILRVSAARATARAIDGARLVILPGVGEVTCPAPLWPTVADEVCSLPTRPGPPRRTGGQAAWPGQLPACPGDLAIRAVKAASQRAARAPSMARWSTESVQRMTVATARAPSTTTGCCRAAPTARMPDCGGLMIAENSSVPYMPRLETEKVPPSSSCWRSRRSRARARGRRLPGDSRQALGVDPAQHGGDQAALGRDRDRYVDGAVRQQALVAPGDVGLGHVAEGRRDRHDDEVVDRDLAPARSR